MDCMDIEELAIAILGISDEQADEVDIEELLYEKFGVSVEQFHKIAESLEKFTVPMQAGISGDYFRGFVRDGYFITKTRAMEY